MMQNLYLTPIILHFCNKLRLIYYIFVTNNDISKLSLDTISGYYLEISGKFYIKDCNTGLTMDISRQLFFIDNHYP